MKFRMLTSVVNRMADEFLNGNVVQHNGHRIHSMGVTGDVDHKMYVVVVLERVTDGQKLVAIERDESLDMEFSEI